jgi:hypothetical protein
MLLRRVIDCSALFCCIICLSRKCSRVPVKLMCSEDYLAKTDGLKRKIKIKRLPGEKKLKFIHL